MDNLIEKYENLDSRCKQAKEEIEELENGCSCHIDAPCSFCEQKDEICEKYDVCEEDVFNS